MAGRVLPGLEGLSTAGFALAVAEEFVVICLVTYGSIIWDNYYLWLAIFMAFSVHLFVHVGQWIVWGRYLPVIVTSLISLPYCVYGFLEILESGLFSFAEIVLWTVIGVAFAAANLVFAHWLGGKVE